MIQTRFIWLAFILLAVGIFAINFSVGEDTPTQSPNFIGQGSGLEWNFNLRFLDDLMVDIEALDNNTFAITPYTYNESIVDNPQYRWKATVNYTIDGENYTHTFKSNMKKTDLNKTYYFDIPDGLESFTLIIGKASTIVDGTASNTATAWAPSGNICVTPNGDLRAAWLSSGDDVWFGNFTDGTWYSKEITSQNSYSVGITCADNGDLTIYYLDDNGDSARTQISTNDGASWVGYNEITSFASMRSLSCVVDANNDLHCCGKDAVSDLVYINETNDGDEISADDSDQCDIEVGPEGDVYIVVVDSSTDDLDIMSNSDDWVTRNEVCSYGTVSGQITASPSIAINDDGQIEMAYISGGDVVHANGSTSSLSTWSCAAAATLGTTASPDIAISENEDIYIMYSTGTTTISPTTLVLINSSDDGLTWDDSYGVVTSQANAGFGSIAQSMFSSWNNISDTMHFVYTTGTDVYYDNVTVQAPAPPAGPSTCNAPESGNWVIECSNNCFLNQSTTIPANLIVNGTGRLVINTTLNFTAASPIMAIQDYAGGMCQVIIEPGGKIFKG